MTFPIPNNILATHEISGLKIQSEARSAHFPCAVRFVIPAKEAVSQLKAEKAHFVESSFGYPAAASLLFDIFTKYTAS